MFETIYESKPAHFQEFLRGFFSRVSIEQHPLLKASIIGTFVLQGRLSTKDVISHPYGNAPAKKKLAVDLAAMQLPVLEAPQDLWIEFQNRSLGHASAYGKLDRINLNTTMPSRFRDFVKNLYWGWTNAEKDPASRAVQAGLMDQSEELFMSLRQRMGSQPSVEKLAALFAKEGQKQLTKGDQFKAGAFKEIADNLLEARHCFETRCYSSRR